MSWQAYVDTNMVGTGHVSKGAILGLDGTVWAKSPDFNISAPEAQHIAQNISNPGALQGSGARVEEEKHFCVRADGSFAYTKKGDSGMCIVKCKQCILVGLYNPPVQPGMCNTAVEKLGDYLKDCGY